MTLHHSSFFNNPSTEEGEEENEEFVEALSFEGEDDEGEWMRYDSPPSRAIEESRSRLLTTLTPTLRKGKKMRDVENGIVQRKGIFG